MRSTCTRYQPHAWDYGAARNPVSLGGLVAVEAGLGVLSDGVVVNCRAEAVEGRRHGVRAPTSVIGLPIDLDRFSPATAWERAEARRRLAPGERALAIVVGEPSYQKGHDRLLTAWEDAPVGRGCTRPTSSSSPPATSRGALPSVRRSPAVRRR